MDAADKRRVIPAWRLIGGIFLHFTVPAYLLTLAIAGTAGALHGRSVADMLGGIVPLSARFLLAYALIGCVSVGMLAIGEKLVERWRAPPATAQARRSAAGLARTLAIARQTFGNTAGPALDTLGSAGWNHEDARFRAIAIDLGELVARTAAALASAPPDRRAAIEAIGLDSLGHIAASFRALADERSRLDEGDARVIARYVESRYGPSDFSSSG